MRSGIHFRRSGQPVLAASNPLSTRHQRFACARLSQSYLPKSRSDFSATFTTVAFDNSSVRCLELDRARTTGYNSHDPLQRSVSLGSGCSAQQFSTSRQIAFRRCLAWTGAHHGLGCANLVHPLETSVDRPTIIASARHRAHRLEMMFQRPPLLLKRVNDNGLISMRQND
jgi:hypothetical protein